MTKGKSYNRIVFFTTLSVYLGLVLAGATPQVLAYAATTRAFDVQNEIEFKDDLDNKPDNEEADSFFDLGLDEAVAGFVEDLRRLKQQGKYKSGYKETLTASCAHSYCSEESANAAVSFKGEDSEIADALTKLHAKVEVSEENNFYKYLYEGFRKDNRQGCKEIGLKLAFDQNALTINFEFPKESPQKAAAFAENLNRAFAAKSGAAKNLLTRQTYENTRAKSENKQVFIVTRLPRASIDAQLARNAQ